jgi:hypothetical protein
MSNNSGTDPAASLDSSRFLTEKVAEEGGVLSDSTGGSPASKHSNTSGGGSGSGGGGGGGVECGGSDKPQATTTTTTTTTESATITTNRGAVPDGNCSPGGAPEKGKERNSSDRNIVTFIVTSVRDIILIFVC